MTSLTPNTDGSPNFKGVPVEEERIKLCDYPACCVEVAPEEDFCATHFELARFIILIVKSNIELSDIT